MAQCEQGYLCEVCGHDVEDITVSDLYLRYVLGEVDPETLHVQSERHIRCNPTLAQFIVADEFPPMMVAGPFAKAELDPEFVTEEEARVTRGYRRLLELPALGLPITEYPLPEAARPLAGQRWAVGRGLIGPRKFELSDMPWFGRSDPPEPIPAEPPPQPRMLFLDDDPERAGMFLAEHPEAIWVQTAAECIARLEETWHEVHLDHDLGGEHFVNLERDDCGMEVVRWLCKQQRPHLRPTRFTIHSHNTGAATTMGLQMILNGYNVVIRPFGVPPEPPSEPETEAAPAVPRSRLALLRAWLRRVLRREDSDSDEDYGYVGERPGPDEPRPERPDFDWLPPAVPSQEADPPS